MICNERLEKLLNRAGQTISDLPKPNERGMPYRIDKYEPLLKAAADFTQFNAPAGFEVFNVIQYALHLTDIIDRMEWALENVCGERDYLRQLVNREAPCSICVYKKLRIIDEPCNTCLDDDDGCPSLECFGYAGVPEDWSVDDETSNA